MKFFSGSFEHQLDAKNRIRIPSKFRNSFPEHEKLYFFRYNDDRIAVMSESVLSDRMSVVNSLTPADQDEMVAAANVMMRITEIAEDNQGRVMIPKSMREMCGINKDVITIGMGNFIEIWSKELFEAKAANLTAKQVNVLYAKKQS